MTKYGVTVSVFAAFPPVNAPEPSLSTVSLIATLTTLARVWMVPTVPHVSVS
jgi:hypothetical protein